MDEKHIQKLGQHEELQFEQYIDSSVISYEDDISSKEKGPIEPIAKWIIGRKRKHSPKVQLDQQLVKDLIINVKQEEPTQPSAKQYNSKKTIIDESFKNILNTKISSLHNYSKISDSIHF